MELFHRLFHYCTLILGFFQIAHVGLTMSRDIKILSTYRENGNGAGIRGKARERYAE